MITVTQNQTLERWDTLPLNLREALYSEDSSDFLWKTCEDEHIPDERIYDASKVVGYVFMGFLHPEDVAQELKERLNIDSRIANDIATAINQRIFTPLRADIDKVYQPLGKLEVAPSSSGPVTLKDIGAPATSTPVATSQATSQTLNASPSLKGAAIPNGNIVPNAPKPNRLSDVGWSRSRSADPVVKLDVAGAPKAPVTLVPTASSPQSQQPVTAPSNHAFGEFERMNAMKKAGASVPAPATTPIPPKPPTTPAPSSEPAPFMLHEDTTFKAQTKNTDFNLPKPGASAQAQMSAVRPQAAVRPAVLEFGGSGSSSTAPKIPTAGAKVIHYTEYNSTLSSAPTANSGPRKVEQITAAAPLPSTPPIPKVPQPPRPPQTQPVQAPQEKVIVKDFL